MKVSGDDVYSSNHALFHHFCSYVSNQKWKWTSDWSENFAGLQGHHMKKEETGSLRIWTLDLLLFVDLAESEIHVNVFEYHSGSTLRNAGLLTWDITMHYDKICENVGPGLVTSLFFHLCSIGIIRSPHKKSLQKKEIVIGYSINFVNMDKLISFWITHISVTLDLWILSWINCK